MKRTAKTALAVALGALLAPVSAIADTVSVQTTQLVTGIANFDWGSSNVIAIGGNDAFVNFVNSGGVCSGTSCTFTVLAQGSLNAFVDSTNNPISGTGLNTSYEITYQVAFQETVELAAAGSTQNIATFAFTPGGTNFFRMYYDTTNNADDLAGTGFNDGTLVLAGTVAPSGAYSSSFTANTTASSIVDIGGAQAITPGAWAGQETVSGSGSTSNLDLLSVIPTTFDTTFWKSILDTFLLANLSTALPFTTVDPSISWSSIGGPADARTTVGSTTSPCGPQDINGSTVDTNGGAAGGLVACGSNIIFQSDPNGPIAGHTVPEPGTLALVGLGMAFAARLRNRKSLAA